MLPDVGTEGGRGNFVQSGEPLEGGIPCLWRGSTVGGGDKVKVVGLPGRGMFVLAGAVAGKVLWAEVKLLGRVTGVTDMEVEGMKLGLGKCIDGKGRMLFLEMKTENMAGGVGAGGVSS